MRKLTRLFLALALGMPLFVSITSNGGPAVAAPAACTPGTPAPADPYPGTTAAATNFESGALTPFVPFTAGTGTVAVSSAFSHSPGCSAYLHATSDNNSIANMSVPLATGMKEAYADGWFNITKEGISGNDVPYFRFFSNNIRFIDAFRHNVTNDLVLRVTGAQGFVYTTLVGTVPLGSWHHLVMHVVPKGAATGVQIWWDDKSVFAQTVNISATSFDRVQLGAEHDQQMGDIYADDVIINSGAQTPGPIPGALPGGGVGGTVPPAAAAAIQAAAAANPGLGASTSAITCGLRNGGCYQNYQGGAIIWSPATGAHLSVGVIRAAWAASNFENGALGYPTTDDVCGLRNGGCYQNYQGGAIIWSPATGAHLSVGVIRAAWAASNFENGALGYPTTDDVCGLRNGGCYQNYQGGAIIWSPATGAHISVGVIRAAWAASNFENGALGYPTTDNVCGLRNGGCYQNYQGGAIIWSPATGAHISIGGIRAAWATTGFENGRLGYPTTDEYAIGGGNVAQNYQGGLISWSPVTGAKIT